MFRPTLAIIRFCIRKDLYAYSMQKDPHSIQIFSDEKPDDGQSWPKHVVFIIF